MAERTLELEIRKINDYLWEIPKRGGMRVPGRIYANETLLKAISRDNSLTQVVNVAHLPGIVKYSIAMPDIHQGYGFAIGGVAATDPENEGVVSPGGVGYDINCGVRLIRSNLTRDDVEPRLKDLVTELFRSVPCGVGSEGGIPKLGWDELRKVMTQGAGWGVKHGYGTEADLDRIEEGGCLANADPNTASQRAMERGAKQVGTLGSGNHFLEVDVIEEIYRPQDAEALGLAKNNIAVLIHTGSRGFGYQICDDYLEKMMAAMSKYGIKLPDPQLACAPTESAEGRQYLAAMACAANFAWANRQCIMHLVRESFQRVFHKGPSDLGMDLVYDVCHNIAKFEEHVIDGRKMRVCVHRKGATRAFPPGHPQTPAVYKDVGQPVLVPGDMGTCSFVCVGTDTAMEESFGSSCHGAGRVMSRHQAMKQSKGRALIRELQDKGIFVMAKGRSTVAEEMPEAYKDVEQVVDVVDAAGLARKVAKLRPIGVVKG